MAYAQEALKPYGTEGRKTEQIERMFDRIAPSYDSLNRRMSQGFDRRWRRQAIELLRDDHPHTILDVATGTGDFALTANAILPDAQITGIDLSEEMLRLAHDKIAAHGAEDRITLVREDCAALSFADDSFDAVTVAFGVRNFEDTDACLLEIRRVLRDGGRLVILELSVPQTTPMRQLFGIYSHTVIPLYAALSTRDAKAYRYLPKSMQAMPQREAMCQILGKVGFRTVTFQTLTFGVCTLYTAVK
jgi:demethylmenaquinone methyltransferase/2-methoxy-6-polyprenyl-1,4-benzoquinol methylase